jgi:hypothetical protein
MLIAGQAKSLNVVLVTNNVREFKKVKGLKIERGRSLATMKIEKYVFDFHGTHHCDQLGCHVQPS